VIEGKLNQANGRLRQAKVGVAILQRGNRLTLRATLPPRPGSPYQHPRQQEIALGCHANPAGLQFAEREARKVGALIDCNQFTWEPYLKQQPSISISVRDWLGRFEKEYRNSIAPITWETDYERVFKQLDPDQPLTIDLLKQIIQTTEPNTRTRRRFCLALGKLGRLAELECDFKALQGNYSAKQVQPRDLPDDETITQYFLKIQNPGWRWVFGMIATFGLRSHEVFFLDTEDFERGESIITVTEGKTGRRMVWPCYPEWIDDFCLRRKILPEITGRQHTDYTHRVSNYFSKLPFGALDLRHRWAVRTLEFGLDISLAAQQMGHSVRVHQETYHHWITAAVHQRAFEALMLRADRPRAPLLTNR
jgi:integrase